MGNFLAVLWGLFCGVFVFAVCAVLSCFAGLAASSVLQSLTPIVWGIGFFVSLGTAIYVGVSMASANMKSSDE